MAHCIKTGDPVILKNAKGLSRYGMKKGMKGMCNQMVCVDNQELAMFMPNGTENLYYIEASRLILDVEALKAMEAGDGV